MRKSRFTDERVVGIIRAAFAGQIARTAPRCITAPPGATAARSRALIEIAEIPGGQLGIGGRFFGGGGGGVGRSAGHRR